MAQPFEDGFERSNAFQDLLSAGGVRISHTGRGATIRCSHPTNAISSMESSMKIQSGRLAELASNIRAFMSDSDSLQAMLTPMTTSHRSEPHNERLQQISSLGGSGDTLLKLLLRIRPLQECLTEVVIEQLLRISAEGADAGSSEMCVALLSHLKWCENYQRPDQLLVLLLDAAQVLPLELQIDVISGLPAIAPDSSTCHDMLVQRLEQLVLSEPLLLPCVLETVGSVGLAPGSPAHTQVLGFASDALCSAPGSQLPVIVRFLLEQADAVSAVDLLTQIRVKLGDYLDATRHSGADEERTCQTLLLGIFKHGFQANNVLLPAFCSLLLSRTSEMGASSQHSMLLDTVSDVLSEDCTLPAIAVDLWMLFALSGYHKLRNRILSVLSSKFNDGSLTEKTIEDALDGFSVPLEDVFHSILSLTQAAVAAEKQTGLGGGFGRISIDTAAARRLGASCYRALYTHFSSSMHRQDVVASLVGHAVSPNTVEVDTALHVLEAISMSEAIDLLAENAAENATSRTTLCCFVPFIKSMLEDVSVYTSVQLRIIFRILFQCAVCVGSRVRADDSEDTRVASSSSTRHSQAHVCHVYMPAPPDDVMILLRKYMSSVDPIHRRVAIIGSVAHLSQYQFTDRWQLKFGNPAVIRYCDGMYTYTSVSAETTMTAPYMNTLKILLKTFGDQSDMYTFIMEELACTLADGGLGHITDSDREVALSTQSALIKVIMTEVEEVLMRFVGYTDDSDCEGSPSMTIPTDLSFDINGAQSTAFVKVLPGAILSYFKQKIIHGDRVLMSILDAKQQKTRNDEALSLLFSEGKYGLALCLPSVLSLNCACRLALTGHLMDLGVLLGSPLELPSADVLNECGSYDTEVRIVVCESMILCVGWLRAVLRNFGNEVSDSSDSYKLIIRANQLVEAEDALCALLQLFPQYIQWKAPDVKLDYYSAKTGKRVVGETAAVSAVTSTAAEETAVVVRPTIASIARAVDRIVGPLGESVSLLLGRNPSAEGDINTVCHGLSLSQIDCPSVGGRAILHRLSRKAVLRITSSTSSNVCTAIQALNQRATVSQPMKAEPLLSRLLKGDVFSALHVLLMKAASGLQRLAGGTDTLNDSLDMGGVSMIEADGEDITDINCASFGSQFYSGEGVSANEEGLVLDILRLIVSIVTSETLRDEVCRNPRDALLVRIIWAIGSGDIAVPTHEPFLGGILSTFDVVFEIASRLLRVGGKHAHMTELIATMDSLLTAADTPPKGVHFTADSAIAIKDAGAQLSLLCDELLANTEQATGSSLGNRLIAAALKTHLRRAADPIHRVRHYTHAIFELLDSSAAEKADGRTLLNEKSLPAFYAPLIRALTLQLTTSLDEALVGNNNEPSMYSDAPSTTEKLLEVIKLFLKLVNVTKLAPGLSNAHQVLAVALKEGRMFVDAFLKNTKVLHQFFATERSSVITLLNALQKATRQMQSICSYGKQKRDRALANEAPYLKRALESLIYKMKEMASENKCLGAVHVGVLKSRHLDGTEIISDPEEDVSVDGPDSHSEDGSDVASEDLAADYNTVSESVHNAKGFETLNLFEDRCDIESEMERPKRIISPQDLDGDSDTDIIPRKRFKNTVDDDSDY